MTRIFFDGLTSRYNGGLHLFPANEFVTGARALLGELFLNAMLAGNDLPVASRYHNGLLSSSIEKPFIYPELLFRPGWFGFDPARCVRVNNEVELYLKHRGDNDNNNDWVPNGFDEMAELKYNVFQWAKYSPEMKDGREERLLNLTEAFNCMSSDDSGEVADGIGILDACFDGAILNVNMPADNDQARPIWQEVVSQLRDLVRQLNSFWSVEDYQAWTERCDELLCPNEAGSSSPG